MQVNGFDITVHKQALSTLLKSRGMSEEFAEDLPSVGYIVFSEQEPVACAFLRMIEGRSGLFDGLISNAEKPGELRNEAIDILVSKIIEFARAWGLSSILAYSLDESTIKRALRHRFVQLPHVVLSLNLAEPAAS